MNKDTVPSPGEASKTPGFWISLWKSAMSFQFYKQIQHQTFRKSLRYLIFLALMLSTLASWRIYHDFSGALKEWSAWFFTTMPEVRIQEGKVSVAARQPKEIIEGDAILVFDTSGARSTFEKKYRTGMIVSEDKLYLRWDNTRTPVGNVSHLERLIYGVAYLASTLQPEAFRDNRFELKGVKSLDITPMNVGRWVAQVGNWSKVTIPVLHFVFYLAGKLIQALLFSMVLSYSHRAVREQGFAYSRMLNLTIYALTPPALLTAVVQIFGLQLPLLEWIVLGMYVAFLLGAMSACAPPKGTPASGANESGPETWTDF